METEIDRLLALRDARRVDAVKESVANTRRVMADRLRRYSDGKLSLCDCRSCLAGYIIGDVSLLCREGLYQLRMDGGNDLPWTN